VKHTTGFYPRLQVDTARCSAAGQAGGVLLTETIRPVTATANEPSTVLRIPRTLFLKMLEGYPEAAQKLREIIATRADQSTQEIYGVRTILDSQRH